MTRSLVFVVLATFILGAPTGWAETVTGPDGSKLTIPPGFKKTGGMQTKSGMYTGTWMNQKKKWSISVKIQPGSSFATPPEQLEKNHQKLSRKYKAKAVKFKGAKGAYLYEPKSGRSKGGKLLFEAASTEALFEIDFTLTRVDTDKYGPEFRKMADKVIRSLKIKAARKS